MILAIKSRTLIIAILSCFVMSGSTFGQEENKDQEKIPKLKTISTADFKEIYSADFESGIEDWELLDDGQLALSESESRKNVDFAMETGAVQLNTCDVPFSL